MTVRSRYIPGKGGRFTVKDIDRNWARSRVEGVQEHYDEIRALLEPFVDWTPEVVPQFPDLDQRARKAICWLPLRPEGGVASRGVQAVPPLNGLPPWTEVIRAVHTTDIIDLRLLGLSTFIKDSLQIILGQVAPIAYLVDPIRNMVLGTFGNVFESRFDLWNAQYARAGMSDGAPFAIHHIRNNVLAAITYAVLALIAPIPSRPDFGPLLRLYLEGNPPLCIDGANARVLIAVGR